MVDADPSGRLGKEAPSRKLLRKEQKAKRGEIIECFSFPFL